MDEEKLVAYCGLYCGSCGWRFRFPILADALHEALEPMKDLFIDSMEQDKEKESFETFWEYLSDLGNIQSKSFCKEGLECGNPECKIRLCAREKNIEVCIFCDEYPCQNFKDLKDDMGEDYDLLINDLKELKKLGIQKWISCNCSFWPR
ncbi:MAG: DUF3795 domain-containing protein [Candidatus Lokiarchaeota archaeon]